MHVRGHRIAHGQQHEHPTKDGMDHPGPPGAAAWTQYRARHEVHATGWPPLIADRAARNFLVAAMAAVPAVHRPHDHSPGREGVRSGRHPDPGSARR